MTNAFVLGNFSDMEDGKNKNASDGGARAEEKFYDFVEAAAHDLQAPLRKLSVLVERVFAKNENKFDESAKEYIDRIGACIGEMRSLIDGFMDLAKSNAIITAKEHCDLNVIAAEIAQRMREEIENSNIVVEMHDLPTLRGNKIQYRQLFKNLFENAIKFRKLSTVARIQVITKPTTDEEKKLFGLEREKKYFTIEVRDNGIGFEQHNAQKIFEPFVRLHSRSEYEGNGLGLFICKKIVANHHGIIYATPNEKEGARFVLVLPETP